MSVQSKLNIRNTEFGIVVYDEQYGDLMKYNPEKTTVTYLDALKELRDDVFQQLEAECFDIIRNHYGN